MINVSILPINHLFYITAFHFANNAAKFKKFESIFLAGPGFHQFLLTVLRLFP